MVFGGLGNVCRELHAAPRAVACGQRPYVLIHGTNPDQLRRRIWNCRGRVLRNEHGGEENDAEKAQSAHAIVIRSVATGCQTVSRRLYSSKMHRLILAISLVFIGYAVLPAHDVITTSVTWNREISRIVFDRCASCHSEKGTAFSLMTYAEARPWAVAIKDEILSRRMPPWGAVKGFGDFRNDQGLSQEQIELITSWVEGGVPEGNPKDLPAKPKLVRPPASAIRKNQLVVSGDFTLTKAFRLDGLLPENVPAGTPLKITAKLPDGSEEPLLWLYEYKKEHKHVFLFRKPLLLPQGTMIRGIPHGASIILLPA